MLEVRGLVPAIAAADVMAKAAHVRLDGPHLIGSGLVTCVVRGDIAAVREALAAGAAAARELGQVVAQGIIGRPFDGISDTFGFSRPRGAAIEE